MNKLFTATLTNATPVFLGGYDTQYYRNGSSEGLRLQSLKGLIRYWMRVYLAGAGYNLDKIDTYLNELLGGKIRDKTYASKIRLSCAIVEEKYNKISKEYERIPRIKLLQLGKDKTQVTFAEELKARLKLYSREEIDEKGKNLIIGSLITGLLLSGLGKMSRRGFGCFDIVVKEDYGNVPFKDTVNKIFDTRIDVGERVSLIEKVINMTRDSIDNNYPLIDIPEIHALHPDYCKILYIYKEEGNILEIVRILQSFTVRSQRGRYGSDITVKKLAWFMGLPRSQKGTGYFPCDKNVERRASAMFISVHKGFSLVTFFKSKDWPKVISWKGGGGKPQQIEPSVKLDCSFNTIFDSFTQYARRNNFKWQEVRVS